MKLLKNRPHKKWQVYSKYPFPGNPRGMGHVGVMRYRFKVPREYVIKHRIELRKRKFCLKCMANLGINY